MQPRGQTEHSGIANNGYAYDTMMRLERLTTRTPAQEAKLQELKAKFGRR